ncbi:hypothetical protein [Pareuzebyella sediminis]|uniref:hypothetical protein n=1 Tax=Pareuzebyella sediminis TaxID=2607998 RepID=UPI0011EE446E|nr:hypothetical protein [Pareuzebyella sediminis]
MNYQNLIRLEEEIKVLLGYRLTEYHYNNVVVEAYYAMDMTVMCRIELFSSKTVIEHRLAKYEAEVKENFYYEAEQKLISQLEHKAIKQAS